MAKQWQYYVVSDLDGKYKLIAIDSKYNTCVSKAKQFLKDNR